MRSWSSCMCACMAGCPADDRQRGRLLGASPVLCVPVWLVVLQMTDREVDYEELVQLMAASPLVVSRERFQCQVCLDQFEPLGGIILRNCLHSFCKYDSLPL